MPSDNTQKCRFTAICIHFIRCRVYFRGAETPCSDCSVPFDKRTEHRNGDRRERERDDISVIHDHRSTTGIIDPRVNFGI